MYHSVVLVALISGLASEPAGSIPTTCRPAGQPGQVVAGNRHYILLEDGSGWSLWEGDVLRWRGRGTPPVSTTLDLPAASRSGELEEIAVLPCPGDIVTGGQLHVWDLEGDGQNELAFDGWAGSTYVYQAVGNNQFALVHELANPVGSYATELVGAGDGDSDGLAELIFSSGTSGIPRDIYVVESSAQGVFPDTVVAVLPEENIGVNHLRVTDLDGDGAREYVGTTQGTHDSLLGIWEARGNNAFARVFSWHSGSPCAISGEIAVGDFDGDGSMELAVPVVDTYTTSLHILECTGDDAYTEVWSTVLSTENAYWVTPGPDLDLDGRGDLVVTGGTGYPVADWVFLMYEADGDNSYRLAWSYQIQAAIIDAGSATGDLDGDGENELLSQVPGKTFVFRRAGDDDLALYWEHDGPVIGQGEHRLVAPDLDADGYDEAVWWIADDPGAAVLYERSAAVFADDFETASASRWSVVVQ